MALPTCPVDPTTVNVASITSLGFECRPGDCFHFNHATYGQWVVRAVRFRNAVAYASGQSVQFIASDTKRTDVTNDRSGGSAGDGVNAAGIVIGGVMTQDYYGFILAKGYYPTVLTNGDDDIAAKDQIIISSTDGVCDSATTMTGAHLGFATAADVDADNTVAAFIDCPID